MGPTDTEPSAFASTDDEPLVAQAQRGGLSGQLAFEALVDRHQTWMVRFVTHLVGSQADAEDIAQDVFLRAFLAIRDCRDPTRFRAWLRVIARRRAFNHRRDQQTRADYTERAAGLSADRTPEPADRVAVRQELKTVLAQLPYPFREVMILRYVEQLDLKEIADVLEIGESAAKMRLARARKEFEALHHRLVTP